MREKPKVSSLHVVSQGSGEPVLLLHSGGMSSRQWRKLAEALAPTHRVLSPDFLGSGENPPWPSEAPFDFTLDVDEVEALLDGLPGGAHVVGHSYGGLIALTLARRNPGAIRSLAVYDPVAFGVLHAAHDAEGLADLSRASDANPVFTDDARGGSAEWLEVFVDYWNGKGSWAAMAPPARDAFLRVGRKVFYEVRSLMRDRTAAEQYAAVKAPALFLVGERSPAAARRVSTLIQAAMPSAELRLVEGAGHMGPISHGGVVNRLIADHIARASSPSPGA